MNYLTVPNLEKSNKRCSSSNSASRLKDEKQTKYQLDSEIKSEPSDTDFGSDNSNESCRVRK